MIQHFRILRPEESWVYIADTLYYQLRDLIEKAMKQQGIDRDALAAKARLRPGRVAQILDGRSRMTVNDAAVLAAALGFNFVVTARLLPD